MALTSPASIAAILDHTLLKVDATVAEIDRLCDESREHGFAAVCVNPFHVARAARRLEGAASLVAAVVGFPLGATLAEIKAHETERVVSEGASEVDVMINVGALKSGDVGTVDRELDLVMEASRRGGAIVKVILETAVLTDSEKATACASAIRCGAAFVKTSTGFGPGGATVSDVALLRRLVGEGLGIKASGGIRDLPAVRDLVAAGATRVGTSAAVRIVKEAARAV